MGGGSSSSCTKLWIETGRSSSCEEGRGGERREELSGPFTYHLRTHLVSIPTLFTGISEDNLNVLEIYFVIGYVAERGRIEEESKTIEY